MSTNYFILAQEINQFILKNSLIQNKYFINFDFINIQNNLYRDGEFQIISTNFIKNTLKIDIENNDKYSTSSFIRLSIS
jgi:hypothetical protein